MGSLKARLSADDQKWVENRAKTAKNPQHKGDIPPELFQLALHAYFFGFEAFKAAFTGHIVDYDENGKVKLIPYDFETMTALNIAAQKVRYNQIVKTDEIQDRRVK